MQKFMSLWEKKKREEKKKTKRCRARRKITTNQTQRKVVGINSTSFPHIKKKSPRQGIWRRKGDIKVRGEDCERVVERYFC